MRQGKSLQDLAKELEHQKESKKDFVAPTGSLKFIPEIEAGKVRMEIEGQGTFRVSEICHDQIGQRLQIPAKYYDRMRTEARSLLIDNVNYWLRNTPEKRMIRTLDGSARAFLSDRFRPLDNYDLAEAVLPKLSDLDCRVESCELTERRMYIKAVCPKIAGEVKVGDPCQAGIVISNSEIGCGSLSVEPFVYRLICRNGAISADYSMRKYHVGKKSDEIDFAQEFYRNETRLADDRAFWMKVEDLVSGTLSKDGFRNILESHRRASKIEIEGSPLKVVEVLGSRHQISDEEQGGILKYLIKDGDLSLYGLMNAVTRFSQDVPDYDRATELERMGGQIISGTDAQIQELVLAK